MAALTNYRDTPRMGDDIHPTLLVVPVSDDLRIYKGGIVAMINGYAVPASTAPNIQCIGIAEESVDNTEPDSDFGTKNILVRQGVFKLSNSAGADAVALVDRFKACYAVDDQTVANTDGGGTRSRAGIVIQVDPDGVWVQFSLS